MSGRLFPARWRRLAALTVLAASDPAGEENVQEAIPQDGRSVRVKLTGRF